MNNQSRTKNTIRNFSFGLGTQILQYILSFATRTIFIALLPVEYLGVNGLFGNILGILSLAELGIGGAFVSLLYKPLHEQDIEKLKSLMHTYKKAYTFIAIFEAAAGLALFPFLDVFIKDNNVANLQLIYLMFLAGSVTSYFYAYKIDFLIADQKGYISIVYTQIFIFIQYVLQIAVLLLTRNFLLYLTIQILRPIISNVLLTGKINRLYPFLKEKSLPLDRATFIDMKNKIKAGMYHHFGYVIINGTDSIVISSFMGVYWVGIYSNYLLIIGVISAFINLTFRSVTASIGNLTASSDKEKSFEIFCITQFINFLLVGFSSVCFIILFNPFIGLWIGKNYLLDQITVILIVAMFYMGQSGMQYSVHIFKETTGLFYRDRYYSLLEGLINIVASIYLVRIMGLPGVFIGTILAFLLTTVWTEAYYVFRYLFERPLTQYFGKYIKYATATTFATVVAYYVTNFIPHETWAGFFIMAVSCGLMTIGIFTALYFRTKEFKFLYRFALGVYRKQIL